MKHSLTSYLKWSIWGFLAMTCISCAHQSKEANLMIDTDTPSEEHVWSENREVEETVAAEQATEEQQLAEVDKAEEKETTVSEATTQANEETPKSEESVSPDTSAATSFINPEEISEAPAMVVANNEVSRVDEGVNSPKEESLAPKDISVEPRREVSSEAPMEEVTPPSRVEPTIGVPAKLKSEEKLPTKKPSNRTRTWRGNDKTVVKNNAVVVPKASSNKAPEVAIVSKGELDAKAKSDTAPGMNELGEENDSTPQLASVEIANFIQHHWLAVLLCSGGFMLGLFFFLKKKGGDDPQAI